MEIPEEEQECVMCGGKGEVELINRKEVPCPNCICRELNQRIAKNEFDLNNGEQMYIAMRDRCARTEEMLAASEAEVKRLREALAFVLPFAEKELECREASYLPEPLDEAEEGYLTEAQEAVSVILAALKPTEPIEDADNGTD